MLKQHRLDSRHGWRWSLAAIALFTGLMLVGLAAQPTSIRIRSVTVTRDAIWNADPNGRQTPEVLRGLALVKLGCAAMVHTGARGTTA